MNLFKKADPSQKDNNATELRFSEMLHLLPPALNKCYLKNMGTAFLMCAITVFMMLYFKSWAYSIGLLISVYIVYLGLDIVWAYHSGKLICKPMVCIKASKLHKQERLFVIMREVNSEKPDANDFPTKQNTHEFYVSGNKKDLGLITPGTILNVYYRPRKLLEMTAWEIVDYSGST